MSKPELYNLDAERSLIGAVLIAGNEVLDYPAVKYVKPQHFYDARHRVIWQAFKTMNADRQRIDSVSISYHAAEADPVLVNSLMASCTMFVNADQYASIIIEQAKRRYSEVVISNLGRALYDNGHFGDELQASIENLQRIQTGGPGTLLPWDIYTLEDAYQERDPLTYVVEGLFCLPSLNIVYGAPGCLKSMLLADMALCVAAGVPWLESPQSARVKTAAKKTVCVPVLWLDFDNGIRRTHERMDALGSARSIKHTTPFYYVSMPSPWLMADDENSVNGLATIIQQFDAGLVIIDNLGTVSGEAEENTGDMIKVFSNFRQLADKTGAAVVIIHHERKATGYKARSGEKLRGHGSIEGALDLALHVEREPGKPHVEIMSTKTRGVDVMPFSATFAYDHRPGTTDLLKAQFYGQPITDKSKTGRARRAIMLVLEGLEQKLNKGQLVTQAKQICDEDEPKVGKQYFVDAITQLVQDGKVREDEAGRDNARLYSLV